MSRSAAKVSTRTRLTVLSYFGEKTQLTGRPMTEASLPPRLALSDFRVGGVLNRTLSVLSRNFLTFFIVTAIAGLPTIVLSQSMALSGTNRSAAALFGLLVLGGFLAIVLYTLSQAIVLYGAFQDMRGRSVSLAESLQVGLRRFFPIIGVAISVSFAVMVGLMLFLVPGLIWLSMWFVATPVCVVEKLGPFQSMGRSADLTKGHRWKIFGLMLLLFLISAVASSMIGAISAVVGGPILELIASVIWNGIWGAFYAVAAVVTYHDLRVAKEGVDIEQIASVFD
jgi:MFS family permease